MTIYLLILNLAAAQIYTDTFVKWSPVGKEFDLICFDNTNNISETRQSVVIKKLKDELLVIKDKDQELSYTNQNCVLEQKIELPIARVEFLDSMYKVDCDISMFNLRKFDFRLMKVTPLFTSIKRLTDGRIWILPTKLCKFKMVLKSLKYKPPTQETELKQTPISLNGGV